MISCFLKHKSEGYITLEILVAITILIVISTLSYTPSTAFLQQYHQLQVRIAMQHFASDIRKLQQKSLFENAGDSIVVLSNNKGYYWDISATNKQIYTYFSDICCEGVYFERKLTNIHFSNSGTPIISAPSYVYELKHIADKSFACTLTVQAFTGRLDINEIH